MRLLASTLLIVLLSGCIIGTGDSPDIVDVTTTLQKNSKELCEASGGRWEKTGQDEFEACNPPTSDAGKTCFSEGECEGACVSDVTMTDLKKAGGLITTAGRCTGWKKTKGCNALVEGGQVRGIICS
jgi:hypothetical protein